MSKSNVSNKTRNNWWINAALFLSGVITILSGIYFLLLPSGGYQGGHNSLYNIRVIFDRHNWDMIHTWVGAAMILAAVIHFAIHWLWVVNMARRTWKEITGVYGPMNLRGHLNLIVNVVVIVSFIITALSSVYFLYFPGNQWIPDPMIIFSRTVWDLIHTWAGVTMTAAVLVHFVIHWKWVVKVTNKMFGRNNVLRQSQQVAANS